MPDDSRVYSSGLPRPWMDEIKRWSPQVQSAYFDAVEEGDQAGAEYIRDQARRGGGWMNEIPQPGPRSGGGSAPNTAAPSPQQGGNQYSTMPVRGGTMPPVQQPRPTQSNQQAQPKALDIPAEWKKEMSRWTNQARTLWEEAVRTGRTGDAERVRDEQRKRY
jgi:hypothetical protein